ncbi:hypothetical protein EYF80_000846 [Liparis tanakae]|uniref:Uncharacterized protein n=1 Tax=Liparis tanakae TaxID=230148 RepID=A0A4Z2JH32_9TELE|nr:hypothetical protein EYF80_000846 [Liparis tanakae]
MRDMDTDDFVFTRKDIQICVLFGVEVSDQSTMDTVPRDPPQFAYPVPSRLAFCAHDVCGAVIR